MNSIFLTILSICLIETCLGQRCAPAGGICFGFAGLPCCDGLLCYGPPGPIYPDKGGICLNSTCSNLGEGCSKCECCRGCKLVCCGAVSGKNIGTCLSSECQKPGMQCALADKNCPGCCAPFVCRPASSDTGAIYGTCHYE